MTELLALRGPLGLPVEADEEFVTERPISIYAAVARAEGHTTA